MEKEEEGPVLYPIQIVWSTLLGLTKRVEQLESGKQLSGDYGMLYFVMQKKHPKRYAELRESGRMSEDHILLQLLNYDRDHLEAQIETLKREHAEVFRRSTDQHEQVSRAMQADLIQSHKNWEESQTKVKQGEKRVQQLEERIEQDNRRKRQCREPMRELNNVMDRLKRGQYRGKPDDEHIAGLLSALREGIATVPVE